MPTRDERIEDVIRVAAQSKRIRVNEFFKDFDRLRTGFITRDQFKRCLDQTFGLALTPDEELILFEKYNSKRDGMVNYRMFGDVIDCSFKPNDLSLDPVKQVTFSSTVDIFRPLSAASEARCDALLHRLTMFYLYRGINLRTCYEDFDNHHNGLVTESQFFRSFPGPDVTDDELMLLAAKYADPQKPGLCNYLRFHNDVVAISRQSDLMGMLDEGQLNEGEPATPPEISSVIETFDRIRVAVYRNGIRTTEFFRDHDKLRSGVITRNQFTKGLLLAVGKEVQLSKTEVEMLTDFYTAPDGRIRYKEFCDSMENAFNDPDLEKKPTIGVIRPPLGSLSRSVNQLTSQEEKRVEEVVAQLAQHVQERRLMTYPFFKDYDRGMAYTRNVTPSQFGRILSMLSLNVQLEDLKLISRKFQEPVSGDVNYPAFVQAIDKGYTAFTVDPSDVPPEPPTPILHVNKPLDTTNVNFDEILGRIRHHVLSNRIRTCEFFQDFDPLRTGSITSSIFRRGLDIMGVQYLTNAQYAVVADHYADDKRLGNVRWTDFLVDVDTAFTQIRPNLETLPVYTVPNSGIYLMPQAGTMDWMSATRQHTDIVERTMEIMRQRSNQRRVLAKPIFQDFDKHNHGYVTRCQFRQCLTILSLPATEEEMGALEAKFSDNKGFNYIKFLAELQPEPVPQRVYEKRMEDMRQVNTKRLFPDDQVSPTFLCIMTKIKTKVSKHRIRVIEFMRDYDKLRKGHIAKNTFRRALDLCTFELNPEEVEIIEQQYLSAADPEHVNYLTFCDDIDAIFTMKGLEKDPLAEPLQFKPAPEVDTNVLLPEAEAVLKKCLERLAEKVRKTRMQLFPLFEDYDRVHNGTVSRSQFRRVLSELELGSLVGEREFDCIFAKYVVKRGGKHDVGYIPFCDTIYELAHLDWRKP